MSRTSFWTKVGPLITGALICQATISIVQRFQLWLAPKTTMMRSLKHYRGAFENMRAKGQIATDQSLSQQVMQALGTLEGLAHSQRLFRIEGRPIAGTSQTYEQAVATLERWFAQITDGDTDQHEQLARALRDITGKCRDILDRQSDVRLPVSARRTPRGDQQSAHQDDHARVPAGV